ncbi:hypothetical protein BFW38_00785 [Terasakiispira papahanaumokuakeensis]|uniref:Uncharacterized protein n=1 Tax=Terasakiispira papahanaumokuakeensis TaxID=197479 RepID=A0A1E2V605_9GAMM|nr:hypothetical protein BFW38_00785 [Terasakiispira papahanaumokuakeensis]
MTDSSLLFESKRTESGPAAQSGTNEVQYTKCSRLTTRPQALTLFMLQTQEINEDVFYSDLIVLFINIAPTLVGLCPNRLIISLIYK